MSSEGNGRCWAGEDGLLQWASFVGQFTPCGWSLLLQEEVSEIPYFTLVQVTQKDPDKNLYIFWCGGPNEEFQGEKLGPVLNTFAETRGNTLTALT